MAMHASSFYEDDDSASHDAAHAEAATGEEDESKNDHDGRAARPTALAARQQSERVFFTSRASCCLVAIINYWKGTLGVQK